MFYGSGWNLIVIGRAMYADKYSAAARSVACTHARVIESLSITTGAGPSTAKVNTAWPSIVTVTSGPAFLTGLTMVFSSRRILAFHLASVKAVIERLPAWGDSFPC